MRPTYYVRHPDDSYSVASPQPPSAALGCGVVGYPEAGKKVCELSKEHVGYHQQGNVRWLGYHNP